MDGWALLVAVLAFVVSGAALVIAWWQLVLQREEAGQGILFGVARPHRRVDRVNGVKTTTHTYRVMVELVGNDRHYMAVHLERDGRRIEPLDRGYVKSPATVRRMTGDHEGINWEFDLSGEDVEGLRVVLSWASPFGSSVRTAAYRCELDPPGGGYEEWHWYRTYRMRRAVERWGVRQRSAKVRTWLGKPRPLGKWRPYYPLELSPGQNPLNSRFDE